MSDRRDERPIDAIRLVRRAVREVIEDIQEAKTELIELMRDVRPRPIQSAITQRRPIKLIRRRIQQQTDDHIDTGD
ncbi:MAG: hypothetical protein QW304_07905 [Thermoproteota archaeon]